jgi:S-adenosylmethionine-diacylgycerolhomoserine-N-methlytransferase
MNASVEAIDGHAAAMDRMYRFQRHVYDATRRYYLLGRDEMLDRLSPPDGGSVLEIGCGTGRNLVGAAKRYPAARLYGIDISSEMLKSASDTMEEIGGGRTVLACADAVSFDPLASLGCDRFDRIYFSFALSMIPGWQKALEHASTLLSPGGEMHIVDFGQCEELPEIFRRALFAWLSAFQVNPRWQMPAVLREISARQASELRVEPFYRGYSRIASLKLRSPLQVAEPPPQASLASLPSP